MTTDAKPSEVRTASPADVAATQPHGKPPEIIDVRQPAEYAEAHVAGAKLVPLDVLDPRAVMADRNGGADQPLYVICQSGSRSAKAVEKFRSAGFDNVVSVAGGTKGWEQAGLPIVRGRKIMSLERQVRIGAGALILLGILLGWLLHPGFLGLSAFVAGGLVFAGVTDWCGMGLLLAKMPWNNRTDDCGAACSR